MRVGFVGLGLMGLPMAANLLRAGMSLCVHNRSSEPFKALAAAGAEVADSAASLFGRCDAVILMLPGDHATDAVLGRDGPDFANRVTGRLIINMGTHSPEYSRALSRHIAAAGGRFVEAPVSGSRGPAEAGELVAMVAGAPDAVANARPLIAPLCREQIEVGEVPRAMAMKLAVNLYLISSVTALAEATRLATAFGLDLDQFARVITTGPLGSSVATAKLNKMVRRDFAPQAAVRDALKNARLVASSAEDVGSEAPLLRESLARFETVRSMGGGTLDMAAILMSYEAGASPVMTQAPRAAVAAELPARTSTNYPAEFASRVAGRRKHALGDPFGLASFGVNRVVLPPGAQSSVRHRHLKQDEFVYVLEGELTLIDDDGELLLGAGMCAGFRHCGTAHHLVNRSGSDAVYLEVGDRLPGDAAVYPDDDLKAEWAGTGWRFTHRDGTPWTM